MHRIILTFLVMSATGCIASQELAIPDEGLEEHAYSRYESRQISSAEIRRLELSASTAYEIVERRRPLWLWSKRRPRGLSRAVVYVDNVRYGGIRYLQDVSAQEIESIRYVDAVTATLEHGPRHPDGALYVTTIIYAHFQDRGHSEEERQKEGSR